MEQIINIINNQVNKLITIDDAFQISSVLMQCVDLPESLALNLNSLSYAKPMGDALFARELREFVRIRKINGFSTNAILPQNQKVKGYLDYIGFFDFIGLLGNFTKVRTIIEKRPISYLPITKYEYSNFNVLPNEIEVKPFCLIENQAELISGLFTMDSRPNILMVYIIREILRNCFEHSKSASYYVWGQYLASDNSIELVFLDDGVGILYNLKDKYPCLATQEETIIKALEPGVLRVRFDGSTNKYNNSGFGLYVISELAKRHGVFFIASKEAGVLLSSNISKKYRTFSAGTTICIRINRINDIDYGREISEIVSNGEKISMQSEYPTRASKHTITF